MPDYGAKAEAALSSSIEREHDSLVRSLSGDVMSMQEDMVRPALRVTARDPALMMCWRL